jgi:hemerythrin-like domain-containing protein
MRASEDSSGLLSGILARLEGEHDLDESFADELTEELEHLATAGQARNPEVLGYMLRGFFESYRRHIHWETDVLLPMARQMLSEADLTELANRMEENRSGRA